VKEPAVATRENFDCDRYTAEQLENLKLQDGIVIHKNVKLELELYARQNNQLLVKPFILVVAQDTSHASRLVTYIESEEFYNGRYKNRVITVHSNQRGEEKDETIERLVAVEDPKEPTEIVIHVNMLKEGWDVTNLYTIVPLRAANSRTLVEQSVGRGLRLPYGKRTGVSTIDRLTIVAHDRFQEIIDEANNPNSIIRKGIVIGRDIPPEPKQLLLIPSNLAGMVEEPVAIVDNHIATTITAPQQATPFSTPIEREVARTALKVIEQQFHHLPSSTQLKTPEVQTQLVEKVTAAMPPVQGVLQGVLETASIPTVVSQVADLFISKTIDIPRIIIVPKGEITSGFRDFDIEINPNIRPQPVPQDILIQHLRTHERERMQGDTITREKRLEDYIVRRLIDYDDIYYEDHADLLYKLATQVVAHIRSYLSDEDDMHNVLQYYDQDLARLIYAQMQNHYWEAATTYEAEVGSIPLWQKYLLRAI